MQHETDDNESRPAIWWAWQPPAVRPEQYVDTHQIRHRIRHKIDEEVDFCRLNRPQYAILELLCKL